MPLSAPRLPDTARTQWLLTAFVLLAFGVFLAYFILHERDLTLERERDRLFTQVRVIDSILTQQLAGVDEAMRSLRPVGKVSATDTDQNPQRSATMRSLVSALPSIRNMQMLDPNGMVVSTSRTDMLGFDASQRGYFVDVKKAPQADTLYVSAPFTTTAGVFAINLARAWTGEQKALHGVTTATLDPEYFKVLLRSVLYAGDMRATLVHGDGLAFLTQPDDPRIQGADLKSGGSLFSRHVASGQVETYFDSAVAVTNDRRLVVYRTVWPSSLKMNQPLMLAVSRGQSAVLAPWRQLLLAVVLAYVAVSALTLGALYFFQRKQSVLQKLTAARDREIQEHAERLDLALAGGNLGLFDMDMLTGVRQVNARAKEMVGDGPDDPADTFAAWSERIHLEDHAGAIALREAHERGETESLVVNYRVRHKNGNWIWIQSRSRITQRRADGTPLRMVGTYMDITERLQAEKVLHEERLRLANIIDGTNAGTWEHNLLTGEDHINDQYARMLGYSKAEMEARIGGNFRNIVHPDDLSLVEGLWDAHLEGATPSYEAEFRVMHKDGHWSWILSHGKVWSRDKDGKALSISGIHLDVSAIKATQDYLEELNGHLEQRVAERTAELEAALQQLQESQQTLASSEARATMGTMVAGLSHELGAPLGNGLMSASTVSAGVRGFRKLLADGGLKRSDMLSFLDMVEQGAEIVEINLNRAHGLLKNFRQVAADQASEQRRTFDLAQVVQEIMQTLGPTLKRQPHRVTVDIAPGIAMDSQPGPLGQIIINLVNNAYLHAFEDLAQGELRIHAHADGDWVQLEVRDNGRGIPGEYLEKMFEPFVSTKIGKGGTGLGMAIVQNLVDKTLGGSIEVHSVVGEGTTFTIRLPKVIPQAAPAVP